MVIFLCLGILKKIPDLANLVSCFCIMSEQTYENGYLCLKLSIVEHRAPVDYNISY